MEGLTFEIEDLRSFLAILKEYVDFKRISGQYFFFLNFRVSQKKESFSFRKHLLFRDSFFLGKVDGQVKNRALVKIRLDILAARRANDVHSSLVVVPNPVIS